MKSINIFTATRVGSEFATEYINMLSEREKNDKVKSHEYESLKALADIFVENEVPVKYLDGFFFSYKINQISKEFDLLKIRKGKRVLNIELKSVKIEKKEILRQLLQNRYYTGHIAEERNLFTFIASSREFYRLQGKRIVKADVSEVIEVLMAFDSFESEGIESLFEPKQFLISPLNNPDKFLYGEYFLTDQQQRVKEEIIALLEEKDGSRKLLGITGKAGTGKTLLMYDIVRRFTPENHCLIIHTGILCDGHQYLSDKWQGVDIVAADQLALENLNWLLEYAFIFVDEAQRMSRDYVDKIIRHTENRGITVMFSYDEEQYLSVSEMNSDIAGYLKETQGFIQYELSQNIRTGVEIASFCENMFDLKRVARGPLDYSDITVLYADNISEAKDIISLYRNQLGYTCISYHPSIFSGEKDAYHHVIGQEYDDVLLVLDHNFYYDDEGKICGRQSPDQDLITYKVLYQDVSRIKDRLCILVIKNYQLFLQIASIKFKMLERTTYKVDTAGLTFSGKRLNKLSRLVKRNLGALKEEDALLVSMNIDIVNDELFGSDTRKKILKNSLMVLERLRQENCEQTDFYESAGEYLDYAGQYL